MTELGRGCSLGCRFCAAGFIYRPRVSGVLTRLWAAWRNVPRKWTGSVCWEWRWQTRVLDRFSAYLGENSCCLSFSSLRADRISSRFCHCCPGPRLKSVAIAPDGSSERLRRVINKGLTEEDLLAAADQLVEAGIVNLKLYVMIGLPTETETTSRKWSP